MVDGHVLWASASIAKGMSPLRARVDQYARSGHVQISDLIFLCDNKKEMYHVYVVTSVEPDSGIIRVSSNTKERADENLQDILTESPDAISALEFALITDYLPTHFDDRYPQFADYKQIISQEVGGFMLSEESKKSIRYKGSEGN